MNPFHVVIRRWGIGWRWMLLDLDELVDSGTQRRWIDAQRLSEKARKEYRTRIIQSERNAIEKKKMLDAQ